MLTQFERMARDTENAANLAKLAKQREIEAANDAEWDNATRFYWPYEAADAVTSAKRALAEGTLTQADHDLLVTSINARTRRVLTPESAKATFEQAVAAARGTTATAIDALTAAQRDALWDSIK